MCKEKLLADSPARRWGEYHHRIGILVGELCGLGCPESKQAVYLEWGRGFIRSEVLKKRPGLRYWTVGRFHWEWNEFLQPGEIPEGAKLFDTYLSEKGGIYKEGNLDRLAQGDYPPIPRFSQDDVLPKIISYLEGVLKRA